MRISELLAEQLDGTRAWTLKLLHDLEGSDWHAQPRPGLAHPLWLCGHLACAQHLLVHARCLGVSILDDAFMAHFPIGAPVKSAEEHDYPPLAEVRRVMDQAHGQTLAAIRHMTDGQLAEPAFGKDGAVHPHYKDKRGAVSHCARHEAFHAGQLATIRRLLGKGFLR
jgi:hypothetical protein